MVTLGIFGGEWFRRRGSIYSDERGSISAFFPLTTQQSFIPHNSIYLFVVYQIAKSIQLSGHGQISVANKLDLQSPFDVVYHLFIRNHSAILFQCIHRGFTAWPVGFMPIIIGAITHLSPLNYITHRCPMTKLPANTHFKWFAQGFFFSNSFLNSSSKLNFPTSCRSCLISVSRLRFSGSMRL
jgi:hypothetical protein